MTVENNILAAVLDNFRILRIDLDNPMDVDGKKKKKILLHKKINIIHIYSIFFFSGGNLKKSK